MGKAPVPRRFQLDRDCSIRHGWERMMAKKTLALIGAAVLLMLALARPVSAAEPVLKLGWSGSGIGADLLKLAGRTGVWRKHGLDVRPVYLTSGNLMAQTLSSGEIGLTGFDVTAMLALGVSGARDLRVIAVMIDRLEPFFVVQKSIAAPAGLKGKRVTISRFGSGSDIMTRVALRYSNLDTRKGR